jgi:hypothetical protein
MLAYWKTSHRNTPYVVEVLKVVPDSPGSGLFIATIKAITDRHPHYEKGDIVGVGADQLIYKGKTLHYWGLLWTTHIGYKLDPCTFTITKEFLEYKRKFEADFVNSLENTCEDV